MPSLEVSPVTEADLAAIARIHLVAFPDSALTKVGLGAVRRYYHWLLTGPHEAVAIATRQGGDVTGFAFGGLFSGAVSGFVRTNALYLAGRLLLNPRLLGGELFRARLGTGLRALTRAGTSSRRPAPATPAAPRVPERIFGVLAIAVDPRRGRSGAGTALMSGLESAAHERGFAGMHLTVSPQNTGAVQFYERLGWERAVPADGWRGVMRKRVAPR